MGWETILGGIICIILGIAFVVIGIFTFDGLSTQAGSSSIIGGVVGIIFGIILIVYLH